MAGKPVIVVGYDESAHSQYALDWTLQHFFTNQTSNSLFKLVVVHAKATPVSVLGLAGPANSEVYSLVEVDLKKRSDGVVQKVKEVCKAKSVEDVHVVIQDGDPRMVICEAVDKYNASFLVVGSHGYGALTRAVLGSVSDHCSHHAKCSVMIVKDPKG